MQQQVLQEQEKICGAEKSETTEEEKEEEKDQKIFYFQDQRVEPK